MRNFSDSFQQHQTVIHVHAVEAAACGTPVIATTSSPLPRLLAGGGLFVNPREPSELKAALEPLLEKATVFGDDGGR